jgi:tetratricopeptide (TPR) repeat protein/transcriptional regulator with XRE-family HTH domain
MTSPQPRTFSGLLRRYRMAAGLTQEQLAEAAGLSPGAVSTLERGISRSPRRDTVGLLADALGLAPAERSLFERAAHDRFADAPAEETTSKRDEDVPALVGRDAELLRIDRFLTGEGPPVLLVMGESGIGKTRLLQAAAERATPLGWTAIQGTCHRRSATEPYAPFPGALLRLLRARSPAQQRMDLHGCGWLARLLPELTESGVLPAPTWSLPPDQERRLMFAAVVQLLVNVARPAGTLLVLDDLQWASVDGLDLLAALLREATLTRLRVVAAYRAGDIGTRDALATLVADLAREGSAEPLQLGPLDQAHAAALLDTLLDQAPQATREAHDQALRRAGGVPFYLVSFAQELQAHGAADVTGREAAPLLPWQVAASIRQRVALLPEAAQEALAGVAVGAEASRGVPHGALATVARQLGHDEQWLATAVEAAQHAQLLMEVDQGAYTCAHELIGEVVRADLTTIRRRHLHRLLGEALEGLAAPDRSRQSAALAWHFAEAGAPDRALPYAMLAGGHAEAVAAFGEAEQQYRTAIDLARQVDDAVQAAEAQVRLGALLDNQGRFDEAIVVLELAASDYQALGDREGLARATHRLARACHRGGRITEGAQHLQALVAFLVAAGPDERAERLPDLAGPDAAAALDAIPHGAAARLGVSLTTYLITLNRPDDALETIELAAAHADRDGDAQLVAHTMYTRGNVLKDLGRLDEAEHSWRTASVQARAARNLDVLAIALANLGLALTARGELTEARAVHEQALEAGTRLGDPYLIGWSRGDLAELAYLAGDWDAARKKLEPVAKTVGAHAPGASRAVGLTYGAGMPLALLGRLDLAEGRTDEGTTALDQVLRLSENSTAAGIRPWAAQALAESDLLASEPELARRRLEPVYAAREPDAWWESPLPATLAWALAELGEPERAWQIVEAVVESARARRLRLLLVESLPMLARVGLRAGRRTDAVQAAEEALTLARVMAAPYPEAKALFARGLVHTDAGEAQAAAVCYDGALAILRRLGERLYAGALAHAVSKMGRPI